MGSMIIKLRLRKMFDQRTNLRKLLTLSKIVIRKLPKLWTSVRTGWFNFQDQAEKASLEEIVKNHDNSKKREARNLAKMQATATDSKILEHTKPNPVSAAQDEIV